FNAPTPQALLRSDGLAGLGVTLPELGLPRIMAAGRRTTWHQDIAIGASVRRDSRIANVMEKQGRSGRFAIVTIEHRIYAEDLALIEEQDYVMREPDGGSPAAAPQAAPKPTVELRPASAERSLVPDETLLLRYCAVTFNAHRIHYDQAYATGVEGYPALVVNGGIPILALLELYRIQARHEPNHVVLRNLAPLFCGRAMRLCADPSDQGWQLWAEDDGGRLAVEMTVT
ncbi:MAG: FAS1-like dehydratase domain-containing protein, partial [Janthinobacterium lividum]